MKLTPDRRQIESGQYPLAKTLSGISFPDEPIARLRNHNATDHGNVDFRSFFKNLHSKLGKLM